MPPLLGSPLAMSSGITASPRNSKSDLSPYTQIRQYHNGPIPAPASPDISPPAMPAMATAIESPSQPGSAGYFGFVVDPTDPVYGTHSKKNWSPASSSIRSAAARSPLPVHLDNPPTPFQMQAEVLAQKRQFHRSLGPAKIREPLLGGHKGSFSAVPSYGKGDDYFSAVRSSSPVKLDDDTGSDQPWPLTAPKGGILSSGLASPTLKLPSRVASAPTPVKELPALISADRLADLISKCSTDTLLLLDVRTYKSFADSRVLTAVNLCIPTTLLKRPSFNVAKLSDTFANCQDKERFGRWKQMKHIVVYDADSKDASDPSALAALHTLNKFSREGWGGQACILKGGFAAFSSTFPEKVDSKKLAGNPASPKGSLSLKGAAGPDNKGAVGGVFNCPLPAHQPVVNPFFSNIRQNMDLIDGVGEIPIQIPTTMGIKNISQLPAWLQKVACSKEGSKIVADRFLSIEKAEQRRMQDALNVSVVYDSSTLTTIKPHALAGVEKGSKNRYNNIWPFDHSRVKLQEHPVEECDYVNASHVCIPHSRKRYIASQAPLPSTFRDFWCMVWEQDVRVIVMLTAEEEGGRVKSHKYWETGEYGPLKLTRIQERKVSLEPTSLKTTPKRRSVSTSSQPSSSDSSVPFIIVRKFTLEHTGSPFSPMREITQLQYSGWPDLGTPTHPSHVLELVEHTNAVVRASTSSEAAASRRPVLVHCSAGCGRTGTFCAVDSVISMMDRQRANRKRVMAQLQPQNTDDGSNGDGDIKMNHLGLEDEGDWITRDDDDLVFNAVSELRDQRISMVQCLQQYVLCYETVLEWLAKQGLLDSGKRKA